MDTQNTPVHFNLWHRDFWRLCFANLFLMTSIYMLLLTIPYFMAKEGYSVTQIGVVYAAYGLGIFLLGGFCSYLVQRYRRNRVCQISILGVAVSLVVLYYLETFWNIKVGFEMLVAMRIAQGASGAMMGPQILSLMQVLYRPHERFRVMSIFGLLGGAAGILGPVLGGIIIESNLFGLSWRPIFLINVPVIVVAVILAWRALPAVRSPAAKGIDPLGTLLAVVGGGALLLTLIEGPALRWPLWMALPPLLSLITVSLLWRHLLGRERRGGTLLLPPAVLRDQPPT